MTEQVSEEDIRRQLAGINPEVAEQQLNDKIGLEFVELRPEQVVGTMPVKGNLQPYGLLHGGANAAMAEALGSAVSALNAGAGKLCLGLELSCTHHRPALGGLVTGVAKPLHVGRGTVVSEIVISDENGKRTCTARLTCIVKDEAG